MLLDAAHAVTVTTRNSHRVIQQIPTDQAAESCSFEFNPLCHVAFWGEQVSDDWEIRNGSSSLTLSQGGRALQDELHSRKRSGFEGEVWFIVRSDHSGLVHYWNLGIPGHQRFWIKTVDGWASSPGSHTPAFCFGGLPTRALASHQPKASAFDNLGMILSHQRPLRVGCS